MAFPSVLNLLRCLPRVRPPFISTSSFTSKLFSCPSNFSTQPVPSVHQYQWRSNIIRVHGQNKTLLGSMSQVGQRNYHHLSPASQSSLLLNPSAGTVLRKSSLLEGIQPQRTVVKFSRLKGRRKTVKAVIRRFFRLDWGIWIRPKAGRSKHLWKKGTLRKKRLRQHVFTNARHTQLLDRMTTKYWHKKKYYVNDPYEPYHTRNNFNITKNVKSIDYHFT